MKYLSVILAVFILLTGCSVAEPAETTALTTSPPETTVLVTTAPEPTPETTVPVTTQAPDPLDYLLSTMTTEEKVGQLFLARCPDQSALEDITTYHLGGYILFGRDFDEQTPDSLRSTLNSYQAAANIPMLIAVDEEGGTVCRVSSNSAFRERRFSSPRNLYDQGGLDAIRETEMARMTRFSEGVTQIPGVTVYGDFSAERTAVVTLNIWDEDSSIISDTLFEDYDIATRPGAHCAPRMHQALGTIEQGAVRFSFSWFNTEEDVDAAIEAVRDLA